MENIKPLMVYAILEQDDNVLIGKRAGITTCIVGGEKKTIRTPGGWHFPKHIFQEGKLDEKKLLEIVEDCTGLEAEIRTILDRTTRSDNEGLFLLCREKSYKHEPQGRFMEVKYVPRDKVFSEYIRSKNTGITYFMGSIAREYFGIKPFSGDQSGGQSASPRPVQLLSK